MKKKDSTDSYSWGSEFIRRHPVISNIVIIAIIAVLGLYAVYLAMAIFTKHGRSREVPGVEKMSYTEAISKLHDCGFKVDIRDSLYREDVKPGYVIEQFPKAHSIVKPGRKIFLYINAVHPKEVILDDDNHPNEYALKGASYRSAISKLEELGFKNVKIVRVLGTSDRVIKVMANGRPIRKMQKIPVNTPLVLEISDGRLDQLKDSLQQEEMIQYYMQNKDSDNGQTVESESSGNETYSSEPTQSEENNESQYID